jgi:hypothetical protein
MKGQIVKRKRKKEQRGKSGANEREMLRDRKS